MLYSERERSTVNSERSASSGDMTAATHGQDWSLWQSKRLQVYVPYEIQVRSEEWSFQAIPSTVIWSATSYKNPKVLVPFKSQIRQKTPIDTGR